MKEDKNRPDEQSLHIISEEQSLLRLAFGANKTLMAWNEANYSYSKFRTIESYLELVSMRRKYDKV